MPPPPRTVAALLIAVGLALAPRVARGDDSASQAALADGREALALYEAGQYAEALATFMKAEEQYHTPVFLLYIARCRRELGHLLAARATFERVLGEQLSDAAPEPWTRAQTDAKTERDAVAALIPELTVTLAEPSEGVTLTIDGKAATLGEAIELDPGAHVLRATLGERSVERSVMLEAGRDERVVLELEAAPRPVAPKKADPLPREPIPLPPPAEPDAGVPGLAVAGYVLSGLGIAGITAGIITGVMALDANDAAGVGCDPLCPPENVEDADRALTLAHASTGSFVVGGTALGLGILFILLSPAADGAIAGRLHVDGRGVGIRF